MDFNDRFVLLRGSKVKNERIQQLKPSLTKNNFEFHSNEKTDWCYFIVDFKTDKIVAKFKRLTYYNDIETARRSGKGRNRNLAYTGLKTTLNLSVFEEYKEEGPIDFKNYKSSDFFKLSTVKENNIDQIYSIGDDWIIAVSGKRFIVNSNAFIDFEKYFTRKNKIDRLLKYL